MFITKRNKLIGLSHKVLPSQVLGEPSGSSPQGLLIIVGLKLENTAQIPHAWEKTGLKKKRREETKSESVWAS